MIIETTIRYISILFKLYSVCRVWFGFAGPDDVHVKLTPHQSKLGPSISSGDEKPCNQS